MQRAEKNDGNLSLHSLKLQTGIREPSVPSGLDCTYKVSILKKASQVWVATLYHIINAQFSSGQDREGLGMVARLCSIPPEGVRMFTWGLRCSLKDVTWSLSVEQTVVWSKGEKSRVAGEVWQQGVVPISASARVKTHLVLGLYGNWRPMQNIPSKALLEPRLNSQVLGTWKDALNHQQRGLGHHSGLPVEKRNLSHKNHMDRGHCAVTGAAFVSTHLESHNSSFSAGSDVAHGTTLRKAHRWPGPIRTDTSTSCRSHCSEKSFLLCLFCRKLAICFIDPN